LLYRGFHGELDKFGTLILAGDDELLTSFEGPQDMPTINPNNGCLAKVSQDKDRAGDGQASLRIEFPPTERSVDVGVSLGCGARTDWSGFAAFVADVFYEGNWDYYQWAFTTHLDGDQALHHHGFRLRPGWNKNVVLHDLTKAAEKADLKSVKRVYLYTYGTKAERAEPLVLFLDNVRLVHAKTGTVESPSGDGSTKTPPK
jgi:hypothetical protein